MTNNSTVNTGNEESGANVDENVPTENENQNELPKSKKKNTRAAWRELVESDAPKFRKVDFEHALTKEEKQAKRLAKLGKTPKPPKKKKDPESEKVEESAPKEGEVPEEKDVPVKTKKTSKKEKHQKSASGEEITKQKSVSKEKVLKEKKPKEKKKPAEPSKETKKDKKKTDTKREPSKEETSKHTETEGETEGESEIIPVSTENEKVPKPTGKTKKKLAKKEKPHKKSKEKIVSTKSLSTVKIKSKESTAGSTQKISKSKKKKSEKKDKTEKIPPIVTSKTITTVKSVEFAATSTSSKITSESAFKSSSISQSMQSVTDTSQLSITSEEESIKKLRKKSKKPKGKKSKKKPKHPKPEIEEVETEVLGEGEEIEIPISQFDLEEDEEEDWGFEEEEVVITEIPDATLPSLKPGKKGKQGKKKDKKKKKKKEPIVEDEEEIPEYMKEIMKMKELALAPALGLDADQKTETEKVKGKKAKKEKEEKPKKEGKGKKKEKMTWDQIEKARIAAELEAKKALEEERQRAAFELKSAKEKDKRELNEHQLREDQLQWSLDCAENILSQNHLCDLAEKEEKSWQQYLKCDGLPNPSNCAEMNTYLHIWEQDETVPVNAAAKRMNEVLKLLDELDDFITYPIDEPVEKIENCKWIRSLFRNQLKCTLDKATYSLLRDIYKKMNRIDIPTADYHLSDLNFALNLFVMVPLPIPIFNPRNQERPNIKLDFQNMNLFIEFPESIHCKSMAIRGMYLKYDHLSDTCDCYYCPPVLEKYTEDLLQSTTDEWYGKVKYRYENRIIQSKEINQDEENQTNETEPEPPEEIITDVKEMPLVPYRKLDPTPSSYVLTFEDELYLNNRKALKTRVPKIVVNLRKYTILGGCYCLNLFYQPPQAKEMVSYDTILTVLELPKSLKDVIFRAKYKPPDPLPPGKKIKQEKLEEMQRKDEEKLRKLMLITIDLPKNVMWFDVPKVCYWVSEKNVWITARIYKVSYDEQIGSISFRTGKFGCYSLAVTRFVNLPFKSWNIQPELDGSVTFQLTASILCLEFNITNNLICLTQVENAPNNALKDKIGIRMKFFKLKRIMQAAGVDIFPDFDTHLYVENTSEKHWPLEKHLYQQIGRLSTVLNFAWSKWNLNAGRRNIVFQMRELNLDKPKQKPYEMILVTPLNAQVIDCMEDSPAFQNTPIEDGKFYADLLNLVRGAFSMSLRTKVMNANSEVVRVVIDLLFATKILSFS